MTNNVQLFNNPAFGSVRTVELADEIFFVGRDVAKILGYKNPNEAIQDHVDDEDKFLRSERGSEMLKLFSSLKEMQEKLGRQDNWFINESGVYALVFGSQLPTAKAFKRWVTAVVLPSIRKTGSYSKADAKSEIQDKLRQRRLDIMEQNAAVKRAKLLLAIGKQSSIEKYNQICQCKAAELVAGEQILPMPKVAKMYSATQIGKMFGVSANKIGRLAKLHNLKAEEYGELCGDVAPNGKQVSNFYYYETAIEKFRDILEGGVVA